MFDSKFEQVMIANAGAVDLLLLLLQRGSPEGREAAASALWNLSWHIDIQVRRCGL